MSSWIWDAFHRETPNQLMVFRRVLRAPSEWAGGSIDIAARGSFRVLVDGVFVVHQDIQDAFPGASSVRVPLEPFVAGRTGVTIEIAVYLLGVGTHHQARTRGGLRTTGSLTGNDGTTVSLDSGSSWQVAVPASWRQNTPQTVWSAGFAEWSDRTAPAPAWGPAVEYPDPDVPTPIVRDLVETRVDLAPYRIECGTIAPAAGLAPDRATALVAMGRRRSADPSAGTHPAPTYVLHALPHQLVGFLTLTVDTTAPVTIDVVMGETLDDGGWPTATRQGIAAVDTLVAGPGRTEHRFWHRRSFRAVALVAHGDGPVTIDAALETITAARTDPVFRSGIDRYDRMHAVSLATVRVGRQDLYEDCPVREGGHYVADARVQALFDLVTTGVATTSARSIRRFADAQDEDGMVPALSPSGTRHRIPDFALQWVCFVDDHVRLTDDDVFLDTVWSAVLRAVTWADGRWDGAHFDVDEPGWWPFVDWSEFSAEALQAAIDAQYAAMLSSAATLARRHGDEHTATRCTERLRAVLDAIGEAVRHPHAATILLTGLDPALARSVVPADALAGFAPETGYFTFWVCRALLVQGDPPAVLDHLDRYWGSMLDAGAGTWWERWSPDREVVESTGSSLCHPWSAAPIVLLPMLALGIDPFARTPAERTFPPVDLGGGPVTASLARPAT